MSPNEEFWLSVILIYTAVVVPILFLLVIVGALKALFT